MNIKIPTAVGKRKKSTFAFAGAALLALITITLNAEEIGKFLRAQAPLYGPFLHAYRTDLSGSGTILKSQEYSYVKCPFDSVPNVISNPPDSIYWIYEMSGSGSFYFSPRVLQLFPQLAADSTLSRFKAGRIYYIKSEADLAFACEPQGVPQCDSCPQCGGGIPDNCTETGCLALGDCVYLDIFFGGLCQPDPAVCQNTSDCGNGEVEPPEECDDGNNANNDQCTNECTIPQCDSCPQCGGGIPDNCTETGCLALGDCVYLDIFFGGLCQPDPAVCTGPFCGNGIREGTEQCDRGSLNSDTVPNACRTNCSNPRCGDSVRDNGEACDDGNTSNADQCTNQCKNAVCGDGFLQGTEACDDGNAIDTDNCIYCRFAQCGDGFIQTGVEQCDLTGGCSSSQVCNGVSCQCEARPPACGNGITEPPLEECDDSNTWPGDSCVNCQDAECGDGYLYTAVEQCETDSHCQAGKKCAKSSCECISAAPVCGNGIIEGQEQCDNGTQNSDTAPNACRTNCANFKCGDGVQDTGEFCDDGNTVNNDQCTNQCAIATCGDGIVQGVEQCDDGNIINTDNCVSCQNARCNDGFIQTGVEQCDSGAGCTLPQTCSNSTCQCEAPVPPCGNGRIDAGEQCDDGNTQNLDGCSQNCEAENRACRIESAQRIIPESTPEDPIGNTLGTSMSNAGDVNGDGKQDVAILDAKTSKVHTYATSAGTPALSKLYSVIAGGYSVSVIGDAGGHSFAVIGDINNDGTKEIAVGSSYMPINGEGDIGKITIRSIKDGAQVPVSAQHEFPTLYSTFRFDDYDYLYGNRFGSSVTGIGDLNADGIEDIAVGAPGISGQIGAVYILFLRENGSVSGGKSIRMQDVGINSNERPDFGYAVSDIGDINSDGIRDIAILSEGIDTFKNSFKPDVFIIFMNRNGSVKNYSKISGKYDPAVLSVNYGLFDNISGLPNGHPKSFVAPVGDYDGDGVPDIAVSMPGYGVPTGVKNFDGSLWILFLNNDGTLKNYRYISVGENKDKIDMRLYNIFGASFSFIGDIDNDTNKNFVVGAPWSNPNTPGQAMLFSLDLDCSSPSCTACINPSCGDGTVNGTEQCDDSNTNYTDACVGCWNAYCGDGFTQAGFEQCDDANSINDDHCKNDCTRNVCGDGVVNTAFNNLQMQTEECDDGNTIGTDGCTDQCKIASCGDNRIQTGVEDCERNNDCSPGQSCNQCMCEQCGNSIREGNEECDDGNTNDFDACSNECKSTTCGDGTIQSDTEECELNSDCSSGQSCSQCKCTSSFILDNTGDFGTIGGLWNTSGLGYSEGGASPKSWVGSQGARAVWAKDGILPGTYDIYMTWVPGANRVTGAWVVMNTSQTNEIVKKQINQTLAPDDLQWGGVSWEKIGNYEFTQETKVTAITNAASDNKTFSADAFLLLRTQPEQASAAKARFWASMVDWVFELIR